MPSFPHPGSVSICEINRDLITAESLSDDVAKDTYGKILGMVFSPVPFQSDQLVRPPSPEQDDQQVATTAPTKGLLQTLQGILNRSLTPLFHPNHVNLLPEVDLQGVSWHQHKHIIAFISGPNQVIVRDFEDSEGKEPCILANESQREVKVLEWRPNVVEFAFGLLLSREVQPLSDLVLLHSWELSLEVLESDILWWIFFEVIMGNRLSSSFTIWDVAQGLGTPIRRGLGGISMLKWSPTGDYFFSAKFDGTFYLWETNTWTSEPWSSTRSIMDPDGHMILLAFSKSSTLGSIHFASKPPSLDAHLLPVELPEIMSLTNSQTTEKIAWDASGERLAVSFKDGDELYRGLIAIYDVRRTPLISASLIGFIRGPGDNPKPLAFSFHDKFKQGPLLFVCWSSGFCCTYPLIFRSHNN
ncbi:Transducin/WD40 repeat-like superfamily protein [Prunus dulcis]|uniref:Transducin/WD40 repeat-like superfamily protein n=1 Tax=Prunus dulcis TaxID=3755 RepID=A0A4Y1RRS3_PRUDU|nr:Transducin/WD40 repeat-like superfamily protein [Prunus dulcis]